MNALTILDFILSMLAVMARNTENRFDDMTVESIQNAVRSLEQVRGTLVTKGQLDDLRF